MTVEEDKVNTSRHFIKRHVGIWEVSFIDLLLLWVVEYFHVDVLENTHHGVSKSLSESHFIRET